MSAPAASLDAYRQSSVLTATPAQLVVMLYDGAARFLAQAAAAIRHGRPAVAHARMRRAEEIILELLGTLDHERGGEVAPRLQSIYAFALDELTAARMTKDADRVDAVAALLTDLREPWATLASQGS